MKQTSRKPVDIESEFIGKPVGPRKQKEKRDDLTEEIHKFMKGVTNADEVKKILLRMLGYTSTSLYLRTLMTIYQLHKNHYIIKFEIQKNAFPDLLYLSPYNFSTLECFLKNKKLDKSRLRKTFTQVLRQWLHGTLREGQHESLF